MSALGRVVARGCAVALVVAVFAFVGGARAQESEASSSPALSSPALSSSAPRGTELTPRSRSGCTTSARATGPLQASWLDGQLGTPRRACLRDEISLAQDVYLIARPADFYGNIRLGTRLSGSVVVAPSLSLWGSLEVLRHQSLISAVDNTYVGLGYLSLGGTYQLFAQEDRALVVYVRTVLPSTTGLDRRALPFALEVGATVEAALFENLRAHAYASAITSAVASGLAPADPRAGLRVGGGLDWVPYEAFSVVLELASGFGYRDALDFLMVSAGLRFAFGDVLGAELGASYPLVGAEPGLLTAQLALTARLDGRGPTR